MYRGLTIFKSDTRKAELNLCGKPSGKIVIIWLFFLAIYNASWLLFGLTEPLILYSEFYSLVKKKIMWPAQYEETSTLTRYDDSPKCQLFSPLYPPAGVRDRLHLFTRTVAHFLRFFPPRFCFSYFLQFFFFAVYIAFAIAIAIAPALRFALARV